MNPETIQLVEELFDRLGVTAQAGMQALASYYRVQAIWELVATALTVPLLWWVVDRGTSAARDHEDSATFWGIGALLVGILLIARLCFLPEAMAALWSPEGHAIKTIVQAVKQ